MGALAERYARVLAGKPYEPPKERKPLSKEEQRCLELIQEEAKAAGATLRHDGEGGLHPSLALSVFRRCQYTCKVHGDRGEGGDGGLELHHISGVIESEWASRKGHKNVPNNLVCLCKRAHDEIHARAQMAGTDSTQVLAEGDVGTRHDHGQPLSEFARHP